MELRSKKPRTYEDDPEVVADTANSIKIAEQLCKGKMQEPHNVEKRIAKEAAEGKPNALPVVHYKE